MGLGQMNDGVALLPPMGVNTWNHFGPNIDENKLRDLAEAVVASGMKDAGYQYIVMDDGWHEKRSIRRGPLRSSKTRFPNGMRALTDYIHSLGLKAGTYTCAGILTCERFPGSYNHAYEDAQRFADWGFDYVKVDWCYTDWTYIRQSQNLDPLRAYGEWRDAILVTGRPIILSICEWGRSKPWEWAGEFGHLWRTTGDIGDNWQSVLTILDKNAPLYSHAGPGHWNDPDMLEVGNGGMTQEEYRSHFSLWCMMAAPLMAGNDLRNMSEETRSILIAKEIIAVNQDPLGSQAMRLTKFGNVEFWVKRLEPTDQKYRFDEMAVALFNRGEEPQDVTFRFTDAGIYSCRVGVRDLWAQQSLGEFTNDLIYSNTCTIKNIPPHGTVMLRVSELYTDDMGG